MPVYSMTGYASVQRSPGNTGTESASRNAVSNRLGLEIRSVNSRFLDLTFRLPEEFRSFEPALRELITAHLKRGKIEVRASIDSASASTLPEPNPRLLQRLNAVQDSIRAWLPQARPLSVADVIRLAVNDGHPGQDWQQDLLPLAEQSVKALLAARQREGDRLASAMLASAFR